MWAAARSFIKQAALKVGRENKKKKKKKREEEAFERLVTRFWPISQNQEAADSLICCCRWESAHCLAREREREREISRRIPPASSSQRKIWNARI